MELSQDSMAHVKYGQLHQETQVLDSIMEAGKWVPRNRRIGAKISRAIGVSFGC